MSDEPDDYSVERPHDPINDTILAYKERFGDTPNMRWVEGVIDEAIELLNLALETDVPIPDDGFYERLGMPPPGDEPN